MKNPSSGHRKRLRERFLSAGLEAFHDHEVLELILTYAIPKKDVKPIAKALLSHFHSFHAVLEAPRELLEKVPGVGLQASILLSCLLKIFERYQQDKQKSKKYISSPEEAWEYIRPVIDKSYESFWLIALDSQNKIIACEMIQKGTVNRTPLVPRMVVEASIKHKASGIIIAHNHPSGNPKPSKADHEITSILKKILEAIDIKLLDHIIVGENSYFSFLQKGELR